MTINTNPSGEDLIGNSDLFDVESEIDLTSVVSETEQFTSVGDTAGAGMATAEDPSEPSYTSFTESLGGSNLNESIEQGTIISTSNDSEMDVHIDDDIVRQVLEGSDDRLQERAMEKQLTFVKKMCIGSLIGFGALFCLLGFTSANQRGEGGRGGGYRKKIPNYGDAMVNDDIFRFNDHEEFHHSRNNAMKENGEDFDVSTYLDNLLQDPNVLPPHHVFPPSLRYNLFDTLDGVNPSASHSFGKGGLPFFWKVPNSGFVVENIMSECFQLVLASDTLGRIRPDIEDDEELIVYKGGNVKYVNVDLSYREGIQDAAKLGLVQSGLADVMSSVYINFATDMLLAPSGEKGRLFTVLRHPVDRVITTYLKFVENSEEDSIFKDMVLEEFVSSELITDNFLVRFLTHKRDGPIEIEDLIMAKEILRVKAIIGLYEDMDETIDLFGKFFRWNGRKARVTKQCTQRYIDAEYREADGAYKGFTVGLELGLKHKVDVTKGSEIYNRIVKRNALDMELFWYAVDLHSAQKAWIGSR